MSPVDGSMSIMTRRAMSLAWVRAFRLAVAALREHFGHVSSVSGWIGHLTSHVPQDYIARD